MQDVLTLRIHRGNLVDIGEARRLFKEAHPDRDFSDFWLEVSRYVALFFPRFFFFVDATLLLLRLRVLRALRAL
jgi:hypothetical protein